VLKTHGEHVCLGADAFCVQLTPQLAPLLSAKSASSSRLVALSAGRVLFVGNKFPRIFFFSHVGDL
jgi:hypothetical protein